MATNDVQITVGANTENFQVAIDNAYKKISTFGLRNKDLAKEIDASFKRMADVANDFSGSVQTSFNTLQIKSDAAMAAMREASARTSASWLSDFGKIANSAETTANDVMRSWRKLGELNATSAASVLGAEFKTLGIQSAESIELAKIKIVNAFKEIELAGVKGSSNVLRAHEAMTAEIQRLDGLLVTNAQRTAIAETLAAEKAAIAETLAAEKAAAQKILIETEAANARISQINKLRAASVNAEVQKILAAEKAAMIQKELAMTTGSVAAATERVQTGISGWSLASIAAIAKIQILYSLINQVMSVIGQFPGQVISAVEDYKSSVISNAAIITSMQVGLKDVGKSYQDNKKYAEGVQNTLIKMDANTAANIKNLKYMNDQFVQQGVLIDVNNEKQKKGFLNIANYLATITANDPNKDMQYSQELRSMKDFSTRAGNRLVQYLETQGVTKEMVEGWKEFGRVTENNGYLLEKLAPYFKGFEAAQADINGLLETAKSTLATIYTEVLRGGMTPAVEALNKQMNELVDWANAHKEQIINGLNKGWLVTKGLVDSVYGSLQLILAVTKPIDDGMKSIGEGLTAVLKTSNPIETGFSSIFKGWSLIAAVTLPTVIDQLKDIAKIANNLSFSNQSKNLFGSMFGSKETKAEIAANRAQLGKDFAHFMEMPGFDERMAAWNAKIKTSSVTGENPTGVGGKKTDDKTKQDLSANPLIATWNSLIAKEKTGVSELEDKLHQNDVKFSTFLNDFRNSDQKKALAQRGITEASIKSFKLDFDNQIRNQDYEKRMVKLVQEGELQIASDKAVFALSQDRGYLKTSKYDVKNRQSFGLLNVDSSILGKRQNADSYGLNTAYSGIPQTSISDAEKAEAATKIGSINAGLASKLAAASGDTYDSKMANLDKQHNDELKSIQEYEKMAGSVEKEGKAARLKNDEAYAAAKAKLDKDTAKQAIGSLGDSLSSLGNTMMQGNKEQFEAGKKMAIAGASIQMTLGAVNAFTSMTSIPYVGVALGAVAAAAVVAAGTMNIAKISSQQYPGRELGGPVTAGQSYIVGEKRPELFTPGASGTITPYVPSQGRGESTNVTQVIQMSPGLQGTVQSEIMRFMPQFKQLAVQAVQQAQRSGQMQMA